MIQPTCCSYRYKYTSKKTNEEEHVTVPGLLCTVSTLIALVILDVILAAHVYVGNEYCPFGITNCERVLILAYVWVVVINSVAANVAVGSYLVHVTRFFENNERIQAFLAYFDVPRPFVLVDGYTSPAARGYLLFVYGVECLEVGFQTFQNVSQFGCMLSVPWMIPLYCIQMVDATMRIYNLKGPGCSFKLMMNHETIHEEILRDLVAEMAALIYPLLVMYLKFGFFFSAFYMVINVLPHTLFFWHKVRVLFMEALKVSVDNVRDESDRIRRHIKPETRVETLRPDNCSDCVDWNICNFTKKNPCRCNRSTIRQQRRGSFYTQERRESRLQRSSAMELAQGAEFRKFYGFHIVLAISVLQLLLNTYSVGLGLYAHYSPKPADIEKYCNVYTPMCESLFLAKNKCSSAFVLTQTENAGTVAAGNWANLQKFTGHNVTDFAPLQANRDLKMLRIFNSAISEIVIDYSDLILFELVNMTKLSSVKFAEYTDSFQTYKVINAPLLKDPLVPLNVRILQLSSLPLTKTPKVNHNIWLFVLTYNNLSKVVCPWNEKTTTPQLTLLLTGNPLNEGLECPEDADYFQVDLRHTKLPDAPENIVGEYQYAHNATWCSSNSPNWNCTAFCDPKCTDNYYMGFDTMCIYSCMGCPISPICNEHVFNNK